jgi:hypothetical protein
VKDPNDLNLEDALRAVALLFGIIFVFVLVGMSVSRVSGPAPAVSGMVASYPPNTVLFITSGDINELQPLMAFAREHNLSPAVWNLDAPPAYIRLGDRNVPLTPPVVTVPTYICRAADANTLIGYAGTDLNVFRLVVSHCYGYVGPQYVRDENTGQVVEVNA